MSYTFHRALIAALATGAMAASGVAFGAPALAATPAPDAYGPMISNLATTSEGIGGQVTFSVTDNPGLSSIDLRDPATDAIFYHRVVDFPGNATDEGLHHYLLTIKFSDIQAACSRSAAPACPLRCLDAGLDRLVVPQRGWHLPGQHLGGN